MAAPEPVKKPAIGKKKIEDPKLEKAMAKLKKDVTEEGMLPKDAMGLTDNMVEGIYGHAYRLYNGGQYREGLQLFRLLVMLDPTQAKYVLGLAACHHLLKEYKSALLCYGMVSMVDPLDPMPHYHASDCYEHIGDIDMALEELTVSAMKCGEEKEFALLRDRIEMSAVRLMDRCKKEVA